MKKGILAYGAYVPYHRLQRSEVAKFFGSRALPGEKAVASFDENSVTMGVEAAFDCLKGKDEKAINHLVFATTSSPYFEKASIPTIARALDLPGNIHGIEAAQSLRAATSALLTADYSKQTLLIAADTRAGAPSGTNEQLFGDGAAALLLGSGDEVIAELIGSASLQDDVNSEWRSRSQDFTNNWEERFGTTTLLNNVHAVTSALLKEANVTPEQVSKVVVSTPDARSYLRAAGALGFSQEQVADPLIGSVGLAGNAHPIMTLVSTLEQAKPGEKILLIKYAEGVDVALFEVTEAINNLPARKGVSGYVEIKSDSIKYSDYLRWNDLLNLEPPRRPLAKRPSAPAMYRNSEQNLGYYGSKCRSCGTPQFPKQRVCTECQAKDQMEDYRFVGRNATIATYTIDYLAHSPAPPTIVAVIDFEGGGRVISEMTDCKPEEVEIGMEVELTFRFLREVEGINNYFWKARPKR